LLGVDCSHGAVWNWVHTLSAAQGDPPAAELSRVAVDKKQITVNSEVAAPDDRHRNKITARS
jgi:hypothetical protein